jgi:predicted RNA-binding protein YlxR (DUF448 family)
VTPSLLRSALAKLAFVEPDLDEEESGRALWIFRQAEDLHQQVNQLLADHARRLKEPNE